MDCCYRQHEGPDFDVTSELLGVRVISDRLILPIEDSARSFL